MPVVRQAGQAAAAGQIREGWHRTDEPNPGPTRPPRNKAPLILRAHLEFGRADAERLGRWDQVADLDARSRKSSRRSPPRVCAAGSPRRTTPTTRTRPTGSRRRTVHPAPPGRAGPAPAEGRRAHRRPHLHRPGRHRAPAVDVAHAHPRLVRPRARQRTSPSGRPIPCACKRMHIDDDPLLGVPVDPDTYDYRRAAWDAVHFARLLDRYWQNLRRCVGWNVQYAGCVEPQKRLAPHAHFAIRGTIARQTLARSPPPPTTRCGGHRSTNPCTTPTGSRRGTPTSTPGSTRTPGSRYGWADALDLIDADPDAEPAHVVRFGAPGQRQGRHAGRQGRGTHHRLHHQVRHQVRRRLPHRRPPTRNATHLDRLWRELRVTPCSDRCANWLLYGIAAEEGPWQAPAGQLQRQGTPVGHPRHRWPPGPRFPGLVGQDPGRPPRRRPRLGQRPPRRHRPATPTATRPTSTRATRPRSPGNSPAPTTPTSDHSTTGCSPPSPNASNGAVRSAQPENAPVLDHPAMFRQRH